MLKGKDGKELSRSEGEAVMKGRGAVTISIYALLLAICTLLGNANSGRVLTNTLLASDTWSFYQAKSIKQTLAEMAAEDAEIRGDKAAEARYKTKAARYDSDIESGEGKKELMMKAKAYEADRADAKEKSPYYSTASAALQIAIVLSSTSILAVSMGLLWASVGVGSIGFLLLMAGYLGIMF